MKTFNLRQLVPALALVAMGPLATAQSADNGRYIEVTVSDTLHISPDVIEFTLSLRNELDYGPAVYDSENYGTDNPDYQAEVKKREEEMKLKMKMTEKRFTDLLNKEKVQYTRADDVSRFDFYPDATQQDQKIKSFVLKFSSFEKMSQFKEKIPEDIKYNGNLTGMSCSKYMQMEEKLLEKLMLKAKKQAQKLAALSDVKLGAIQQYSDNIGGNDLVKGVEQLIVSLMNKYEREKYFDVFKNMNLSKTIRVRYAIE